MCIGDSGITPFEGGMPTIPHKIVCQDLDLKVVLPLLQSNTGASLWHQVIGQKYVDL